MVTPAVAPTLSGETELHDPFTGLPDAPGPSRRDWLLAAGLWGGAAAVIGSGVAVQKIELRIVKQQCFGGALDFNCTRPTPTIRWAQVGGVLLWGSGAGLIAGGVSRLRMDARGHEQARRARLGVGAALTAAGTAGVLTASLLSTRAARRCMDVACLSRATRVRLVTTDVSMAVVAVGAALLASAIRRRSRLGASIDRHGAGLALTGSF